MDDSADKDVAAVQRENVERECRRRALERFFESRRKRGKIEASTEEILAWRHEGHRF